jgi:dynein intermediate chain 2
VARDHGGERPAAAPARRRDSAPRSSSRSPRPSLLQLSYDYVKLRKEFGRPPEFVDSAARLLMDQNSDAEAARRWAPRAAVDAATQAAPPMAAHSAATDTAAKAVAGVSATAGAWPREVDPADAEAVARWRRRVERDEDYVASVARLGAVVEGLARQNNALDVYEEFFSGAAEPAPLAPPPAAASLASLKDPLGAGAPRGVAALAWHPDGGGGLAVAYGAAPGAGGGAGAASPAAVVLWDAARPGAPAAALAAPAPARCLAHNPKDPALLGAGLADGQFALLDARAPGAPARTTSAAAAHRGAVAGAAWTQSKAGTEFMTAGADGVVAWWDARALGERLDEAPLRERGAPADAPPLAASCLEYCAAAGPAKFMVGTAGGPVLAGSRKARSPAERVAAAFAGHHGAVRALQRSPFFPKFFLSVGDWSARLWAEDVRAPLAATPYRPAYLAGGAWSPTRPGVFVFVGSEGELEAWDLLTSRAAPALTAPLAAGALTAVAAAPGARAGRLWAAGGADGAATVLDLSAVLAEPQGDERAAFAAMCERECGRERALERGAKEAKARARREAAVRAEAGAAEAASEEDLRRLEAEFEALASQA